MLQSKTDKEIKGKITTNTLFNKVIYKKPILN